MSEFDFDEKKDVVNHYEKITGKNEDDSWSWRIINSFFKRYGFVRHHLDTYAHFIQHIIPETIKDYPEIYIDMPNYEFRCKASDLFFGTPGIEENGGEISPITPNQCRIRSINYSCPLYVIFNTSFKNKLTGETKEDRQKIHCGMIPVMVKSILCRMAKLVNSEYSEIGECEYEHGGYFIINGTEKVLMGMSRMCLNNVYVFWNKNDPNDICAEISSIEEKAKKAPSMFNVHLTTSNKLGKLSIRALISYFKKEFPVGILLKALGVQNIREKILAHHLFQNITGLKRKNAELLIDSIEEESCAISTREEAFAHMIKISSTPFSSEEKASIYVHSVLQKEFLPHVGISEESYSEKALFLCYMIQKLILVYFGEMEYDDHDCAKYKRIDESGILLGNIFKKGWYRVMKETGDLLRKKLNGNNIREINMSQIIGQNTLTKDLSYPISTGNWGTSKTKQKTGVSQVLNRFNYVASLSHCRRIVNPIPKNSILSKPRQLHNTTWGTTCPFDTPEGHSIGLVGNKALTEVTSIPFNDLFIVELVSSIVSRVPKKTHPYLTFVNGKIIGWSKTMEPYSFIRGMKLSGQLPKDTHVSLNERTLEIYIFTDGGRVSRPLFIVKGSEMKQCIGITKSYLDDMVKGNKVWDDLISDGIVEIVDSGEQENLMVCASIENLGKDGIDYTHCEINPATIIGVCASVIPYANHDPSARITYQSSMAKQAISYPGLNAMNRFDTMMHMSYYLQKPLCENKPMEIMNYNTFSGGQNAVVMISIYGGHNQEDAIILNRASIDRGMFRSMFFRVYKDSEKKKVGMDEKFGIPIGKGKAMSKLGPNGIVEKGTRVDDGDCIIGKISTSKGVDGKPFEPRSTFIKTGEGGVVDDVILSVNTDGTMSVKVRIRTDCRPEVGDKFAAVHSQKGVVGRIMDPEDLPFTSNGIVPDIIINPHCLPSRMTLGHMIEIRSGKRAALEGKREDSTIFAKRDMENIAEGLAELGYQREGWEYAYNGTTGEPMECLIYTGICYYQRLRHMVANKIHARGSKGPIANLTHQPSDGRAREGGLRIGEMERDALISHGASATIRERLMVLSDKFKVIVCDECGLLCIGNPEKKIWVCGACKSNKVSWVVIPYITKLIMCELYSVGIAMRLKTE